MSDEITQEDVTIHDLFSQAQLEAEQYDAEDASLYCQFIMDGHSLITAAEGVFASLYAVEGEFDPDEGLPPAQYNDERDRLKRLLRQRAGPLAKKFRRWRIKFPRFDEMVNLALRQRCYAYVEEMVEIADDATDDAVMGAGGPTINGKAIRRAELMINTRKFIAGKLLPKVFGDKTQMEVTGADGKDLVPTTFNIQLVPTGNFIPADRAKSEPTAEEDEQSTITG